MEVVAVDPAGGAQKYHTDQNGQVVLPDSTEFIFVRSTERWIGCVRSAIKTGELEISEEAWVRVTVTLDVEPTIRKENLRPFVSIVANGTTSQRVQELETPVSRYCSTFATKFVETDTETFLVPKGDIVNVDAGATTRTSETEVAFAQQWVDEANGERMRSVFYATEDRHVRVFLGAEELPDAQTGEWPGGDFEVIGTPFVPEERR